MKKEAFQYPSLKARMKNEYRIILAAFVFILIADFISDFLCPDSGSPVRTGSSEVLQEKRGQGGI